MVCRWQHCADISWQSQQLILFQLFSLSVSVCLESWRTFLGWFLMHCAEQSDIHALTHSEERELHSLSVIKASIHWIFFILILILYIYLKKIVVRMSVQCSSIQWKTFSRAEAIIAAMFMVLTFTRMFFGCPGTFDHVSSNMQNEILFLDVDWSIQCSRCDTVYDIATDLVCKSNN